MNVSDIARNCLDVSPLDILRVLKRNLMISNKYGLTASQKQLLQMMRADIEQSIPPFKPSLRWREVTRAFDKQFYEHGIKNPEEQDYNLCFSGFAVRDRRLHRYVCWLYRNILKQRDSLGLLNKIKATCKETMGYGYKMEDDYLSLDLLLSIDDFYSLYELNPAVATEPLIVAELGAGWGRLGHVLCKVNPKCSYVLFDLPEVLLISQTYLPTLFPDIIARTYLQSRDIERFDRKNMLSARMWYLGPQDMLKFADGSVDMLVNIASFQEMPVDYVDKYLKQFSRIGQGGHCFLRQLRSGKSHNHRLDEIPGIEQYPFPKKWVLKYLRSSMLSDEFFEAGYTIPKHGSEEPSI